MLLIIQTNGIQKILETCKTQLIRQAYWLIQFNLTVIKYRKMKKKKRILEKKQIS